ncbi:DNA repair protein RecN [Ulvibacter litoralis]|uniref:DNA repair protein RecN n=1 Tax=Ulvibacter litoralis TaxID=227084 RepID=A0A1G7EM96_9FLAO|nr:DNA repair protein RecN [Ulvibacter litoralis]GHC54583.1 DNA repair protein RecN [Ulvibacter litoralis]SDE64737.1 DNA repair protein RecN (Recombination protein N) [Ulvibacter litoralis]
MITILAIKNYALIEDIRVDLHKGLTTITGETGAGKSIILGALALLLGKRADVSSVKDAAKKCVIEGEFAVKQYQLHTIFEENDLDYDDHTIIRREILPSGKSRAFVNDSPVSLSQLQTLGVHLVDVHSQNETLSLASESFQMEIVDALANNASKLQEYGRQFEAYKALSEKISELKSNKEDASKELEYNTFLHKELVEAGLQKMNQQELEETYEALNNTELIQESLSKVLQLLSEEQIGAIESAKEARLALGKIRTFSSSFEELWNRINSVIIEFEDLFEGIEDEADAVEADPSKLVEVNEKLQTLYKLQQKHSVATVSELVNIQEELASKIDGVENLDAHILVLEKELTVLKNNALATAKTLHENRQKALPKLKEQLEAYLSELGLPNAQFKFTLETSKSFRGNGTDVLDLLFTANKGLALGSLKKVASGGEMSRIMLSVKAVLAKYKQLPTIIFDEIDTGVSGEVANKMGRIMDSMSKSMQLISITHLPQIAAKGEHHIKVYKEDVENVTQTRLKNLTAEERVIEIAQMIGGTTVTEVAIANAKELLN